MRHRVRSKGGGGSGGDIIIIPPGIGFTDDFSLGIKLEDSNATPTDADTYAMQFAQTDTIAAQTEAVQLGFSGPDFNDSNAVPTDARSALIRVWLSGSAGTGVTDPGNANGPNDGTLAVISTALAGPTNEVMLSTLGPNVPSGITFSSAILTVWFRARTTLVTSTARIQIEAIAATFTSPVTVFTQSTLAGDTNNLSTPLTFDLVAAGINTLAKLQDMRFRAETIDAAAGVTPAILDVDAAACDIVATSI